MLIDIVLEARKNRDQLLARPDVEIYQEQAADNKEESLEQAPSHLYGNILGVLRRPRRPQDGLCHPTLQVVRNKHIVYLLVNLDDECKGHGI